MSKFARVSAIKVTSGTVRTVDPSPLAHSFSPTPPTPHVFLEHLLLVLCNLLVSGVMAYTIWGYVHGF